MFRNFKKKAITVFRKTKAPATTDPPPDYDSIPTFGTSARTSRTTTTTTAYTNTRDQPVVSSPQPPPHPPPPPSYLRRPMPPVAVPPVPTTNTQGSDTSYSREVPNPDSSPPSNNMATKGGYYGHINPDIMSGFGGDDDSIWLVDDEETDEEDRRHENGDDEVPRETSADTRSQRSSDTRAETESHRSQRSQRSHRLSHEDTPTDQAPPQVIQEQAPSAPSPESAPPSFRYSVPTLLDDDEFASLSTTTPETPPLEPAPARRRGYAPISAAILNLTNMDVDDLEEPPTEAPKPRDDAVHPHTTPPASSSSHVNPSSEAPPNQVSIMPGTF